MAKSSVRIVAVAPDHPDALHCLDQYFAELRERFEEGFDANASAAPTLDDFVPPDGTFLVAYRGGRAIGCGGFKRLDRKTAYLKRMWVDRSARGAGIGRSILAALEGRAGEQGFERVCLDTHRSLGEARTLYEANGFRACAPLANERYADHWFAKRIRR